MPLPALTFPMQLSAETHRELQALLAQLNEGYLLAEHRDDGTHGDITAESVTLTPSSPLDGDQGKIRLFDEQGREITLSATDQGGATSGAQSVLRVLVSATGDAISLGTLLPQGAGNGGGPGLFLPSQSIGTQADGWAIATSINDALLSGTSMLAITDTTEGNVVLMLRPSGTPGAITGYILGPKSAYAPSATLDIGRGANGERINHIYTEDLTVNDALTVVSIAASGDVTVGDDLAVGDTLVAGTSVTAPYYVVGTPDTNGIRLKLSSGYLAVREGDDSADGVVTASVYVATSHLHVEGAGPQAFFIETTQPVDGKIWRTIASGGDFFIQPLNDALTVAQQSFRFSRSTGALLVGDGTFINPVITFNADPDTGLFRAGANQFGVTAGGATQALFTGGIGTLMYFGDGSAAAPFITFLNDTDTGIYRVSANQVGITAGGSTAAAFTSSQAGFTDGSVLNPGITFMADPDSGIYRVGANQWALSAGATIIALIGSSGFFRGGGSVTVPDFSFQAETDSGMYRSASRQIAWAINGGERMRLQFPSGDVTSLYITEGAFSAGAVNGTSVRIGRNSLGSGAAGFLAPQAADGTEYAIWVDATGDARISTAAPTANGGVSDTSGTVIGDQTSARSTKNILKERFDYDQALRTVLDTPIFDFTYKSGRYHGETFTGITTDDSPIFGKDQGKSFNEINAFGYLVNAIKAQQIQIETLQAEVARLKGVE